MKRKALKAVLAGIAILGIAIAGCGNSGSAKSDSEWEMEYSESDYDFEIYRDSETGVNYIIYSHSGGYSGMGGLCPRYNADGSLYVD